MDLNIFFFYYYKECLDEDAVESHDLYINESGDLQSPQNYILHRITP